MRPDPEIDEIRATRRRISERHGHDLRRLFQHYQELERQLPAPYATDRPREAPSDKPGKRKP